MIDPAAVVSAIREAFADVPMPSHELLISDHCEECAETSEAFSGKSWVEIGLAELTKGREIALLPPAAWQYYLPAILSLCVLHLDEVDTVIDSILSELEPPGGTKDGQWFAERASGFTPGQRASIALFIAWYNQHEAAEATKYGCLPSRRATRALAHWQEERP